MEKEIVKLFDHELCTCEEGKCHGNSLFKCKLDIARKIIKIVQDSNVVNPLLCDVLADLESINLIEDHETLELDRERLKEVLGKYFI